MAYTHKRHRTLRGSLSRSAHRFARRSEARNGGRQHPTHPKAAWRRTLHRRGHPGRPD